jgi:hypothetical protein
MAAGRSILKNLLDNPIELTGGIHDDFALLTAYFLQALLQL